MPNIKSAKKRVLVTEKKTARNKAVKSEVKTEVKKFLALVQSGDKAAAKRIQPQTRSRGLQRNLMQWRNFILL